MNTRTILNIVERENELFNQDVQFFESDLKEKVTTSRFLVIGGAGTIGQAVVKEIFKRNPLALHVVDLSENNLVELVRDIRSSFGYIDGDFKTFALDIGSIEYDAFIESDGKYDYVLNLSALKHVRSEKDPYTLMRMINVNILNTVKTINQSIEHGVKKYFCVSTDKAANPVNMMGASKKIMELFLWKLSASIPISTARFANVAFSDGSLLHGFNNRLEKEQPIVAPNDVDRYFVTKQESGELCLLSCLLGENGDTFFPKENKEFKLTALKTVAENFVKENGYLVEECATEEAARNFVINSKHGEKWPCFFPVSDTTGEKAFEEFFTENEILDLNRFETLGVIKNDMSFDLQLLNHFEDTIQSLRSSKSWTKSEIVSLFNKVLPEFNHLETGKYLDSKM